MLPTDWTPHRREDGEVVGWIHPDGDHWVAVDLFGRRVAGPVDWLEAEEALEGRGLSWLTHPWTLEREGAVPLRVRVVEIVPGEGRMTVQTDDWGAIDASVERIPLPWPPPPALREHRPDDPGGVPFA